MDRVAFNNLVAKAIAGDKDALNTVLSESYQDLYYYARQLVKKDDLAADVTQDSCEEIIKTIGNLRESAAFVTWSRRIVYHHGVKRVGKTRIVPLDENEDGETLLDRLPDETPGSLPEEVVENQEFIQLMRDMVSNLPESQRSAINLYYFEHFSVKQIADIQDEKEATIKSRLFQGRKAVKKQIEDYEKKTGIKLHSVGLLPLLYYLFQISKTEADAASALLLPQFQAAIAPAIAAASGAAGAGVGSAAVGAAFTSSLAFKIGAAVVAVALAVGGLIAVTQQQDSEPTDDSAPSTSFSEPSQPSQPIAPPSSNHPFQHYAFDDDAHWLICDCPDATDTRYAHSFANGECSVCCMPEPLPGGNPYLTYDTTILGGHWLCLPVDTYSTGVEEFYINGDGSLYIQGKTYYPVGSRLEAGPVGEPNPLGLHFRETPFDPAVGITEQEAFSNTIILELKSVDDIGIITLNIQDLDPSTETWEYFSGSFYRESDYFGYEKVELTLDNYQDYLTITLNPVGCGYSYGTFYSYSGIQFTLKDGLGEASLIQIRGSIVTEYHLVESNLQTQVSEFTNISTEPKYTDLRLNFYGTSYTKHIDIMHGETIPINNVVKWYGNIPTSLDIDSISGYVFVPKQ